MSLLYIKKKEYTNKKGIVMCDSYLCNCGDKGIVKVDWETYEEEATRLAREGDPSVEIRRAVFNALPEEQKWRAFFLDPSMLGASAIQAKPLPEIEA